MNDGQEDTLDLDQCLGIQQYSPEIREALDASVDSLAESYNKNTVQGEMLANDAVHFLAAAQSADSELINRGRFRRFLSVLTGGNNKLRDIAGQHMLESQRSTIRLLGKLADQQVLLMDSIRMTQQAILYLEFQNVKLKQYLVDMFRQINSRFERIEDELLEHRYRINIHELELRLNQWQMQLKGRAFSSPPRSVERLCELTIDYFETLKGYLKEYSKIDPSNLYRWSGKIFTYFEEGLRNSGFSVHDINGWTDTRQPVATFYKQLQEERSNPVLGFLEARFAKYPLQLMSGTSLAGYLLHKLSIPPGNATRPSEWDRSYETNSSQNVTWVDLGTSLLWQLKLLDDSEYLKGQFQSLTAEIVQEFLSIAPSQTVEWLLDGRVEDDSKNWTEIVVGQRMRLVTGDQAVYLYVQFVRTFEGQQDIRIVSSFEGRGDHKIGILKNLMNKGLGDINVTYESNQYFEYGETFMPTWSDWQMQRSDIANRLSLWVQSLNGIIG